jgi:hypothetical protein
MARRLNASQARAAFAEAVNRATFAFRSRGISKSRTPKGRKIERQILRYTSCNHLIPGSALPNHSWSRSRPR